MSKTRGSNTGRVEEIGGMVVEWERDKRARGQVRQQELRGASHYDSSSFFMPSGLDHNLKAPGQTKRPGRPWKTAVSQGTNTDRVGERRGRMMSPALKQGSVK